jgi:DNA modification methylase
MIERCLKSSAEHGALVVEPFSGSGTTLIAAQNVGRRCFAMELDPRYVAVALERWANHTQQEPQLLGDAEAA